MNILEKRIENQVQFWSLLGPTTILVAIAILLFKMSATLYLPLSVLVGIPLCIKWRMNGLLAALSFLCIFSVISFSDLEFNELYWHVGMGMALALSFVILTLSIEEVEGLVEKLQTESQSRLANVQRLDNHIKTLEEAWALEKDQAGAQIRELTQSLSQTKEEKQTFQKLIFLAKDELINLRTQHESLLQDLFYKKQHISQLKEQFEENEATIQTLINSDAQQSLKALSKQVLDLQNQIEKKEQQRLILERQLHHAQQEMERLENDLGLLRAKEEERHRSQQELDLAYKEKAEQKEEKIKCLAHIIFEKEQELIAMQKKQDEFAKALEQQEGLLLQQSEHFNLQLKETIQRLSKPSAFKPVYVSKPARSELPYGNGNTRKIESMYLQLKEQFQEKSTVLDVTRRELFHVQEEILVLQKEKEEKTIYQIDEGMQAMEKNLQELVREMEEQQLRDRQELDGLYHLVAALLKQIHH